MTKSITDTVSTAQADLEKLVGDLRGLLSAKELDAVPGIHMLRQRIDDGMSNVRESAVRAVQEAARQAKDVAYAADRDAHEAPWCRAGPGLVCGDLLVF